MKKHYILLLLILGFSQLTHAQWRISGGLTFTDYEGKADYSRNIKDLQKTGTGVFAKISREIAVGKFLFIEPGVGFNSTNSMEKDFTPGFKNTNIIIPVELGVKLGNRIRLNTGLQANIALSAKSSLGSRKEDIENFKSGYIDWIGGLSFSPSSGDKVHFIFRYNASLGNVIEEKRSSTEIRKGYFSVGLRVGL